ncbi:MAG: penicillin-binding protein 2 [bacterium]
MYRNSFKKELKSHEKTNNIRIRILSFVIFLFSASIFLKLFDLQIINYGFYNALASDQHQIFKKLTPQRGSIYIHDTSIAGEENSDDIYESLYPIAVNKKYNFLYAEPNRIEDAERVAEILNDIFGFDKEELKNKLSVKEDPYEPLAHRVEDKIINQVNSGGLVGINSVDEYARHYPDSGIGGHIIGFVGHGDDVENGQYGIEGYFNEELSGKAGFIKTERDVKGNFLKLWDVSFTEAVNGVDIVLTIDYGIQHEICMELQSGVEKYKADGGSIIVMEPYTGEILGMCSYPDFNPEKYNEVKEINTFNNPALFNQFEPGSIFKPITAAIALDLEKIKPDSVYEDKGEVRIGPHIIRNSDLKAHGSQTMTQVLQESLNTGAIYIARQIGKENFKSYLSDFGFGQLTGIELTTEASGNINSLNEQGEIYMATASFGQGIAVTPLQITTAYAALANGGRLPKTHIVDKIIKNQMDVTKSHPQTVRQVISERASALIRGMLVTVVESGHAKKAGVKGYYVAGKTGTAQVAEKGIYGKKTIHTFSGFAPVDEPKFVLLVKLDNPKIGRFAESTAVPLAHEIIEFILNYYEVPPVR